MASANWSSIANTAAFVVAVVSVHLAFMHFSADDVQVPDQRLEGSESDLQVALDQMLLGDSRREARLASILAGTQDQYNALPKNSQGRLGTRAVRNLVGERGWILRGLEHHGMRRASSKALHEVGLVQHQAPQIRRALLEAKQSENGLALKEVVAYIASLEQLLLADFVGLLEITYKLNGFDTANRLSEDQLQSVLASFIILFRDGFRDKDNTTVHLLKRQKTMNNTEAWEQIKTFINKVFDTVQNERGKPTANPFRDGQYTFEDVWALVRAIAESYGRWQNAECDEMTDVLSAMDHRKSGRVSLRDFWHHKGGLKFNFVESRTYLREFGALDESFPKDPKVIISNYVTGPNNCIATLQHYSFCCINRCVSLTSKIEREVGAPSATADTLLNIVASLSSASVKPSRQLPSELKDRLYKVAAKHGGRVSLHGRLFAQWMHFAFPLECPYPSIIERNGALNPTNKPARWAFVSQKDKKKAGEIAAPSIEQPFMAQWSDEEVLPLEDESTPIGGTTLESHFRRIFQFIILAVMARMLLSFARSGTMAILRWSSNGAEKAMRERWNRTRKEKLPDEEEEQDKDKEKEKRSSKRKQSGQKEGKMTHPSARRKPKQSLPQQQAAPPPSTASHSEIEAPPVVAKEVVAEAGAEPEPVAPIAEVDEALPVVAAEPGSLVPQPPVPELAEEVAAEADVEPEPVAPSAGANGANTACSPTDHESQEPLPEPPSPFLLSPVRVVAPQDAEVPRPSKFLQSYASSMAQDAAPASALQPPEAAKDVRQDVSANCEPKRVLERLMAADAQTNAETITPIKSSKPKPLSTLVWLDPAIKAKDMDKLQSNDSKPVRFTSMTSSKNLQAAHVLPSQQEVQPALGFSQTYTQSAWMTDEVSSMCDEALGCIYPYGFQPGGASAHVHAATYGGGQPSRVASLKAMYEQKPAPMPHPQQPPRGIQPRQQRKVFKIVNPHTKEVINYEDVGTHKDIGEFEWRKKVCEFPKSKGVQDMQELEDAQARERAGAHANKISQGGDGAWHGSGSFAMADPLPAMVDQVASAHEISGPPPGLDLFPCDLPFKAPPPDRPAAKAPP
eukprot:CAMPEP_0115377976 /NCGR_PEP_ID=MMETSP0271-20121206/3774_1 /TAXON_ID=71861 /ORGANISM="Scrippsiella trochoidea, Strain CCMP3099" /LENGTH=1077 /DNA_ID=CAMNT_0002801125 /DNA_START=48 /DNA_END=3278 /DNA_ORIENTATION=+